MAVTKKIEIDGQEVEFRASAAVPRMYRIKFGRDIYKDLRQLETSVGENDEDASGLDLFSLEMFENIAFIMAKHANPDKVPSEPDEWLDGVTMMEKEKKAVQVRVHHPLGQTIRKNVCICGDSLVDCNQVATEVYRLLEEDGDCEIGQIGTRGPSNGRHEGRGSWKWKDYLGNTSLAGKTNAFWDTETNRLDFQKYCATNGFEFTVSTGINAGCSMDIITNNEYLYSIGDEMLSIFRMNDNEIELCSQL